MQKLASWQPRLVSVCHMADDAFKRILWNWNVWIWINFAWKGSNWQLLIIGSGDGLVFSRWQTITRTNDDSASSCVYASPELSELMQRNLINLFHKSQNAPISYPTMHHFVTEMCTFLLQNGALWDIVRCIVGFIRSVYSSPLRGDAHISYT